MHCFPPCSPERPADLCARPCGRREGEGLHFNTRVFHNTHTQGAKICTHKKRPCRKRGECLFWRVSHGHCVNRKCQNVRPPAHKHSGKNTGQHAASMLSIFDTCVFRAIFFASVRLRDPFSKQKFCENRCFHTCCLMLGCHCGAKNASTTLL